MQRMNWKPIKWCLIGLIALIWTLWVSGGYLPAQANPTTQDMFRIGSDLIVTDAQTVGDAFAIGGDVTVQTGATLEGDVFAIGGNIQLAENTQVNGDAFAIGGSITRAENAVINGDEFVMLEQLSGLFERFGLLGTLYLSNVAFWVAGFAIAAIAGLLLLLLLPGHVDAISTAISTRPFTSLIYGVGGIAALIILVVFLSGSVLGYIFLPLANLAVMLTVLFSGTATCLWLGNRLLRTQPEARFRHFWLGWSLLLIISLIPIVGGLLVSFVALFGFGATLLVRYGTQSAASLPVRLDRLEHQPE